MSILCSSEMNILSHLSDFNLNALRIKSLKNSILSSDFSAGVSPSSILLNTIVCLFVGLSYLADTISVLTALVEYFTLKLKLRMLACGRRMGVNKYFHKGGAK